MAYVGKTLGILYLNKKEEHPMDALFTWFVAIITKSN
jgi:hypothetical protein